MRMMETLDHIRSELRRLADPQVAASQRHFFVEPIDSYGIAVPAVRALARQVAQPLRREGGFEEALTLAEGLFVSGVLEEGIMAEQLLSALGRSITAEHFALFDGWVDYLTNWAVTDGFALRLIGTTLVRDEGNIQRLLPWTASDNRWRRRAAAVSPIALARKGRAVEESLAVAERLMEDGDDMVQKGVGWLLREMAAKSQDRVVAFLMEWRERTPRLVLRIACEKMPPETRAPILGR